MANIYEEKSEALHLLLDRARADDGATVLIPDLQRPYVWTPNQVTLLVDSLIRGWPFGTLLMWKVGDSGLQSIPHRQFWRCVDRTDEETGTVVSRMDPPAQYNMVLDGQQRVQSLLLAFGGDAWGFKMEDRDWAQEIQGRRVRGRQGKHRHWSRASLCFDLERFSNEYETSGSLSQVDFRNVLQWVVTDPAEGQSKWPKPAPSYEEPLTRSFSEVNRGRFVRLSRLWARATPNPSLKEAQFRDSIKELFAAEGVSEHRTQELLVPMGELMTTLRDLKLSKVTYLELLAYDSAVWTEDSYNDAIVNIFTRLNTAGRTLTREEITLAWLKVGWDHTANNGRTAGECFSDLLAEVIERGITIEMDGLVNAVSFIWSVCRNDGKLLANRDLLRGATIRPMASDLARRWALIRRAVISGLDTVRGRDLEYGSAGHYSSTNALAVVWAWLYVAYEWEEQRPLSVLQRDAFEKSVDALLARSIDRWLVCSQWAGRWAGSSVATFAGYAKGLNEDFVACATVPTAEGVVRVLGERLTRLVSDLESDATNFVTALSAGSRERVSVYRNALWLWHRLEATRWGMSSIPLRVGKRAPNLDVDHAVSFALWQRRLETGLPVNVGDRAEGVAVINLLGNCCLLEKSFNISKSDKSLASFMSQVHEINDGKVNLADWARAIGIDASMLDPDGAASDQVVTAIRARDSQMRSDLIEFVRGARCRVDV